MCNFVCMFNFAFLMLPVLNKHMFVNLFIKIVLDAGLPRLSWKRGHYLVSVLFSYHSSFIADVA